MTWHRAQLSKAQGLVYAGIYLFKREALEKSTGLQTGCLALPSHSCMTLEERYTQTTSASDLEQGPQS